jgi:quinol monooxygenase YgiN
VPSRLGQPAGSLLEIDCRIKPEKRREFRLNLGALAQLITTNRFPPVVYEDQNEPGHMLWLQEWSNRQALEAYLESDEFLALLGGLRVLGSVQDCRVVDLTRETPQPGQAGGHSRLLEGWRYVDRQAGEEPSEP